jgi:hypothetical protein
VLRRLELAHEQVRRQDQILLKLQMPINKNY